MAGKTQTAPTTDQPAGLVESDAVDVHVHEPCKCCFVVDDPSHDGDVVLVRVRDESRGHEGDTAVRVGGLIDEGRGGLPRRTTR